MPAAAYDGLRSITRRAKRIWKGAGMEPRTENPTFQQRLDALKAEIADREEQVKDVHRRIDRLADGILLKRRAVVDPSGCTGCGICQELCPQGAVRVSHVAAIDPERCTGCGICVQYCPQGAIRLSSGA